MTIELQDPAVEESISSSPDVGDDGGGSPEGSAPVDYGTADASAPQQAAAPQVNYFDHFRRLQQFNGQDDRAIAGSLYQAMQQAQASSKALADYQKIIPYAQDYLLHRKEFETWRKSQAEAQQAKAAPQPEEKPWWNPPEVRDAYRRFLVKDEHGRDIIDPNAPPDAAHALYEAQQYRADFARRFLDNPEQALGPMLEKVVADRANKIVEERFGQIAAKGYVANLEAENSDWLMGPDGQPTEQGRAAAAYIESVRDAGVANPEQAWALSTSLVERDMLRNVVQQLHGQLQAYQQQGAAVAPAAPAAAPPATAAPAPQRQAPQDPNMAFLRREASRNPSVVPTDGDHAPAQQARQRTGQDLFASLLMEQAREDGLLS